MPLGDMFGQSFAAVNGQKPRNSDRIQPGQPLNLRGAFEAAQNIPVAGDALSGGMALYDAAKGDYGSAAMNALGVLPFVTAGTVKGVKNTAKMAVDRNTSKLTEFEQRHLTAQRNAALPIEQGGLGLPVNNTYTDRKEAMRSLDIVHGSPNPNVEQFDAALAGKNSGNSQGDAVWGSSNPANSNGYALNWNSYKTSPEYLAIQEERNGLLPKIADAFSSDKAEFSRLRDGLDEIGKRESSLYNKFMDYGLGSEGSTLYPLTIIGGKDFPVVDAAGANYMKVNQGAIDGARLSGADGAIIKNVQDNAGTFSGTADSVATFNPARIRSRFAAFDPMRRHEADLLGNINPQLAGAMGVTGLGAAYGATQLPDEYKSAIANAFKGQQ